MRVRFLQGIVSIFGIFEPGMVTDVPILKIAESWVRNGIAEEVPDGKPVEIKPALPVPSELMDVPESEGEADPEGELEAFPVPVDEAPEESQGEPQEEVAEENVSPVEEKPVGKKTTRGK